MVIARPPDDIPVLTRYEKDTKRWFSLTHLNGHEDELTLCSSCLVDKETCVILDHINSVPDFIDIKGLIFECPGYQTDGSVPVVNYTRDQLLIWVIEYLQGLENVHSLCTDDQGCTIRVSCKVYDLIVLAETDYGIKVPIPHCSKYIPVGFAPRGDE